MLVMQMSFKLMPVGQMPVGLMLTKQMFVR
jgi:hypothetical protein